MKKWIFFKNKMDPFDFFNKENSPIFQNFRIYGCKLGLEKCAEGKQAFLKYLCQAVAKAYGCPWFS